MYLFCEIVVNIELLLHKDDCSILVLLRDVNVNYFCLYLCISGIVLLGSQYDIDNI